MTSRTAFQHHPPQTGSESGVVPRLKAALGLLGRIDAAASLAANISLVMSSLPLRCRKGESKANVFPKPPAPPPPALP